nr:MAG TPA: PROTEIN/RNA Complex, archaeal, ribosomal, 50S, protein.0A [Caudoviricetes sp.]
MAKLIDDEKLLAVIEEHCYTLCDRFNSTDKGMFLCGIKQAINEQPKVDTERHAHWIKEKVEDITYPWYRRFCSNCKMQSPLGREHNYCPNCGCKMDEKEEQ